MKSNKFENILGYLLKRYNINKPKTIKSKTNDKSLETLFKDKESRIYFVNINLSDNKISIQRLGDNYKDCFDIVDDEIFIDRKIFKEKDIEFQIIYPEELEYNIIKNGDVTFYDTREVDYVTNKIDDNLYRSYEYHFKNKNIECYININVPYNLYLRESHITKMLLKNGNKIKKIEELLSLIEYSIGEEYQNIFIKIKSVQKINTDNAYLETYDGIVRKNKTTIEEETIEYSPINYIKEDNKVKRR